MPEWLDGARNCVLYLLLTSVEFHKSNKNSASTKSIQHWCADIWNTLGKDLTSNKINEMKKDKHNLTNINKDWIQKLKIPEIKKLLKDHFLNSY